LRFKSGYLWQGVMGAESKAQQNPFLKYVGEGALNAAGRASCLPRAQTMIRWPL
jgi:hypothetical protein